MVTELSEQGVKFILEINEIGFAKSQNTLFGANLISYEEQSGEFFPNVKVNNDDSLKQAVLEVVEDGLALYRTIKHTKQGVALADAIKIKRDFPQDPLPEEVIANYERALEFIEGKRSSIEGLVWVMKTLTQENYTNAVSRHEMRVANLPDRRGCWGMLRGKPKRYDQQQLDCENKYFDDEVKHIRQVSEKITQTAFWR